MLDRVRLFVATRRDRAAGIRNDGWMLESHLVGRLAEIIAEREPGLVVELGSGRSTAIFAPIVCGYGGRLVSLEHDAAYLEMTYRMLDGVPCELRLAPLVGGWYDRSGWRDLDGIDLLIVDGPPGIDGAEARAPALPKLAHRLNAGALVVLDDTTRPDERRILARWHADFRIRVVESVLGGYGTGMTILGHL